MKNYHKVLSFVFFLLLLGACDRDKIPEVEPGVCLDNFTYTYDASIRSVLINYCGNPGCHNGSSDFLGDYKQFADVVVHANSGKFEERVFELADMPPPGSDPLPVDEINKLRCWMENNYAEN